IIVSFKLHYHYIQLQYAINLDKAGKKDIYKIDQLQISWSKVSDEMIQRCWFYTKIISSCDESGISVVFPIAVESIDNVKENLPLNSNDQQTEQEVYYQFTDKNLIQTAIKIEQVENEFVALPLTGEKQLNILHSALRIVDERIYDGR
ncbi:5814_t:CDS:2, partial [Cetraspora pellucida]